MTDLQCPATVLLVTSEDELEGEQVTGLFATPSIAGSIATATPLMDAIDVASLRAEIDHLADLHRGETIAIVLTSEELHRLMGRPGPLTVEIDASGWTARKR